MFGGRSTAGATPVTRLSMARRIAFPIKSSLGTNPQETSCPGGREVTISEPGTPRQHSGAPPLRASWGLREPRCTQLAHVGLGVVLVLGRERGRHFDEADARLAAQGGEDSARQVGEGPGRAGAAVEDTANAGVRREPEEMIDAVLDEHEVALLPPIGIGTVVRHEETDLAARDDLAVRPPDDAGHALLVPLRGP